MNELGIWSDAAGGFIGGPYYTAAEAQEQLEQFLADGEADAEIVDWFDED